jgi:acyl carrier protein
MSTLEILNETFKQVFGDNTLRITTDTTAKDVEDWDSLTHINLIVAIEARFKIRFSQKELLNQRNVGDLIADIDRHLSI